MKIYIIFFLLIITSVVNAQMGVKENDHKQVISIEFNLKSDAEIIKEKFNKVGVDKTIYVKSNSCINCRYNYFIIINEGDENLYYRHLGKKYFCLTKKIKDQIKVNKNKTCYQYY